MGKPKVYIDGQAGTTGLQIYGRLQGRADIDLLVIDEERRKDAAARRECLNEADLAILCLPDEAAREAVSLIQNGRTKVIDCSTAHRVQPGWAYGFSELSPGHRADIVQSLRVANPGCHATGFIAGAYPLVAAGVLPRDYPLTCFSLTGYSGGGKKMIAQYEQEKTRELESPRVYGLDQTHKHLPEMKVRSGLDREPVFCPVVDDYYKGMATTLCLPGIDPRRAWEALRGHYADCALVEVAPLHGDGPMLAANTLAGKDTLCLVVRGSEEGERTTVTALFDNLGKGASGAAVQNMNLMLGFEETEGLHL